MKKWILLALLTVISASYAQVTSITPESFAKMSEKEQFRVLEYRLEGTKAYSLWKLSLPQKSKKAIASAIYTKGYQARYLWSETILESEYTLANNRLGFAPLYAYINRGQIIAYRTQIYTDAFDITFCDYQETGKVEDCWPGHLHQEVILDHKFNRILDTIYTPIFYEN